jgi:two-component sensor histidine kinase
VSAEAYLAATVLVAIASIVRWGLGFVGEDVFVFAAYYPAVLFATYMGGAGVGSFAALLGMAIAWWAFLPPHHAFLPLTPGHEIKLLGFLFACALIIWGADSYRRLANDYRRLAERLQDEEKLRKLAVQELGHRLKNKIATIQSIINYQLRSQPHLRDSIINRLAALSATDDLIMSTQGQGAFIRDVLSTELGAYEVSRVSIEGPPVFLSPHLAMTLALLIHELATNAAKYGALSNAAGKLSIRWSLSGRHLDLEWQESAGPIIAPPANRGFGLQLISAALVSFDGAADIMFEPTGLVCKMKATLPEASPSIVPVAETESAPSLDPAA